MEKIEPVKVYGNLGQKSQRSTVNGQQSTKLMPTSIGTFQLGNEPWVLDDVSKGGDVADCDWFIWTNLVLTRGNSNFSQFGLISKILGIREDRIPDLVE